MSSDVRFLSTLATAGLVLMWGIFWWAAVRSGERVGAILLSDGFFKTVVVMGVVAGTVVMSLTGNLEGSLAGAILSGIVGYVLGQLAGKRSKTKKDSSNTSP